METRVDVSELLRRLEKLEGRFPKNARMSTTEGHVHKPAAGGTHTRLHVISDPLDHSGAITSGQHGTFATGDLHTNMLALAGRAGTANNAKLSTDSTGILTGSGASGGALQFIATDHATPGVVEVNRASVTASADMFRGLIGVEANPRWAFGFDASSLVQLSFGAGGATARDIFIKRTAARALRLVSNISTGPVTLGGLSSTDTQPRYLLTTINELTLSTQVGAIQLGPGGATAPDTAIRRGPDAGHMFGPNVLIFPNIVTKPVPTVSAETESPLYTYARAQSGLTGNSAYLYLQNTVGEFGPIGLMRGIHRYFDFAIGGFEVMSYDGTPGLAGVNMWGLLAGGSVTSSTSADAAFSPAVTLSVAISSTDTTLTISSQTVFGGDVILIGTEKMMVLSTSYPVNPVIAVLRGCFGTTAAAHSIGDPVTRVGGGIYTKAVGEGSGVLETCTGITSATNAGIEWPPCFNAHSTPLLIYQFTLRDTTNVRMFIGLSDQSLATMNASDNPPGNYFGLQYSSARGDTNLMAVEKDGTTQTVTSTGVNIATNFEGVAVKGRRNYVRMEYLSDQSINISVFDAAWTQLGSTVTFTTGQPGFDNWKTRLIAGIRNLAAEDKRFCSVHATYMSSPSV